MSINPIDPKWLEILKASGWQTFALTCASLLFLMLVKHEIIPTTDSYLWVTLPVISALIFGCLFIAGLLDSLTKNMKPRVLAYLQIRKEKKLTLNFIPYMTYEDREIIGYLLHHNQKMFQTTQDGGYAAPLISKRIVRSSAVPGQVFLTYYQFPFEIPDHIWSVLETHREEFPYQPPPVGANEPYPWAIHWMAR